MRRMPAFAFALLVLAACDAAEDDPTGNVRLSLDEGGASLDAPGLDADVKLPGLSLGTDDIDIDGMRLYPGSKIASVNMAADEKSDRGEVTIAFESPDPPAKLLAYYERAARDAGFTIGRPTPDKAETLLSGTKGDEKSFLLALRAAGAGTSGSIVVSGE